MLRRVLIIILIVAMSGMISLISTSENTSGGTPTRGTGSYLLCPPGDITSVMEDEEYNSKYWTVGGPINVNSFSTDADWLTSEISDPINIVTTDNEAYWSFDQGDATDDSGNLHHGKVFGATASSGASPASGAMSFDGTDDYIEVPYHASFNVSDEITLDAWIYPTFTDSLEHMIISKGGSWSYGDSQEYELTMDKDRPLFQMKNKNTDEWYGAAPAEPITKNKWHHVAGTYDGSSFRIFIDGVEPSSYFTGWDSNYKGSAYPGGLPKANHPVYIGRREEASWGSLWYEGKIDDARIWDRALSNNEILRLASIPGSSCINLTGTPDNSDVGLTSVTLNVTDNAGHYDQHTFNIFVTNNPPEILTDDVLIINQDELYEVDYESSDDGSGDITWSMTPDDLSWLSMNSTTGILSGTPSDSDTGKYLINVSVDDGHWGLDWSIFNLAVIDINDFPNITTEDVITVKQDENYRVTYTAEDIDDDELVWKCKNNASWLTWNQYQNILYGKPTNDDIGEYFVNITVSDPRGGYAVSNFTLVVENINDPAIWTEFPENITVNEGNHYHFDVNATDIDAGQSIEFSIETSPITNMTIDPVTGEIDWYVTSEIFTLYPYVLIVNVTADDGILPVNRTFTLDITENYKPVTHLQMPVNDTILSGNETILNWTGGDADLESIKFNVYLALSEDLIDEDNLIAEGIEVTILPVKDLIPGNTYYWTVIPIDSFGDGICISGVYSFTMNIPPVSELNLPPDGATVRSHDIIFEWGEITDEPKTFNFILFASTNRTGVIELDADTILYGPGNETTYTLPDPIPGMTYYWTVIVNDGISIGICDSGILSFYVNSPPVLEYVSNMKVPAGEEIKINLSGSDPENSSYVGYDIIQGPNNLTVDSETSVITWIPNEHQIGKHWVTVSFHDDLETVNVTFEIEVTAPVIEEEDDKESPLAAILIIAAVLVILLIIIIIIILVVIKRKGGEQPEPEEEEEEVEPLVKQGTVYTTAWTPSAEISAEPVQGVSPDEVTHNEFLGGEPAPEQPVTEVDVESLPVQDQVEEQLPPVVDVETESQINVEQPPPPPQPEEKPVRPEGSLVDDLF